MAASNRIPRGPCVTAPELASAVYDTITIIEAAGGSGLTAGCGIDITAGAVSVNHDASLTCTAGVLSVTAGAAGTYTAGDGLSESPSGTFNVNTDGTTCQITADVLNVIGDLTAYTVGTQSGLTLVAHELNINPDNITIGVNSGSNELEVIGIGSAITGGEGIRIGTGPPIEVILDLAATDPCLEFSSDKVRVKVATDFGVQRDALGLKYKNPYHLAKGSATSDLFGSGSGASLDGAAAVYGESIPTTITVSSGPNVYAPDNTVLHVVGNRNGGSDYNDQWSFGTAENIEYLVAGFDDYDHDEDMVCSHKRSDGTGTLVSWHRMTSMLLGTAGETVTSGSTTSFTVNVTTVLQGVDPGSTVTAQNTFDWSIDNGGAVLVAKDPTQNVWHVIQAECPA